MSLRIVPSTLHPKQTTPSLSAPSAPGVHDTLRSTIGPHPLSQTSSSTTPSPLDSAHPLETRLKNWAATQENLKLTTLRNTFGMAEPIRRGMELKIVREGEWRPMVLGGGNRVHEDILSGRDMEVGWEDVFGGGGEGRGVVGFHEEMERKVRMN